MKDDLKNHWQIHRHKYFSLVAMIILISIGSLLNLLFIREHIDKNFTRTFETFSYEGLQTFHNSNINSISNLYESNQQRILNLANNPNIIESLRSGKFPEAQHLTDDYESIAITFSTVSVVDKNGIIRSISSDLPGASKYIGFDTSSLSHVATVMKTKKPFTGGVFEPASGRSVISFDAPVIDGDGSVLGIVSGNVTLEKVAALINGDPLQGYYMTATDADGNLILDADKTPSGVKNIKNDEPILRTLLASGTNQKVTADESNYKNDDVFTIASNVQPRGTNTNVMIVSYYDKSNYQQKLSSLKDESNSFYYNFLGIINAIWVIVSAAVIVYIRRRYDKA